MSDAWTTEIVFLHTFTFYLWDTSQRSAGGGRKVRQKNANLKLSIAPQTLTL